MPYSKYQIIGYIVASQRSSKAKIIMFNVSIGVLLGKKPNEKYEQQLTDIYRYNIN